MTLKNNTKAIKTPSTLPSSHYNKYNSLKMCLVGPIDIITLMLYLCLSEYKI